MTDHPVRSAILTRKEIPPYIVGISGASGVTLGSRAVEWLIANGYPTIVTTTGAVEEVWRQEIGEELSVSVESWRERGVRVFGPKEMAAPIASGSFPVSGMLVAPCSMATVSAIANGASTNLLQRAADCTIKEGRRLVLVPRETPLSAIHLENLLKLARLGVRIVPPIPAFYTGAASLDTIIDQIVSRALTALGLAEALTPYVYHPEAYSED